MFRSRFSILSALVALTMVSWSCGGSSTVKNAVEPATVEAAGSEPDDSDGLVDATLADQSGSEADDSDGLLDTTLVDQSELTAESLELQDVHSIDVGTSPGVPVDAPAKVLGGPRTLWNFVNAPPLQMLESCGQISNEVLPTPQYGESWSYYVAAPDQSVDSIVALLQDSTGLPFVEGESLFAPTGLASRTVVAEDRSNKVKVDLSVTEQWLGVFFVEWTYLQGGVDCEQLRPAELSAGFDIVQLLGKDTDLKPASWRIGFTTNVEYDSAGSIVNYPAISLDGGVDTFPIEHSSSSFESLRVSAGSAVQDGMIVDDSESIDERTFAVHSTDSSVQLEIEWAPSYELVTVKVWLFGLV